MLKLKLSYFIIGIFLFMPSFAFSKSTSDTLTVGIPTNVQEPWNIDAQKQEGLLFDIGFALQKFLKIPNIKFEPIPRKRFAQLIEKNLVDYVFPHSPDWVSDQDSKIWSKTLFDQENWVIVQNKNYNKNLILADFIGKKMGTILGYHYPALKKFFESKQIIRNDSKNESENLFLLEAGRIDAAVASNIHFNYLLKSEKTLKTKLKKAFKLDTVNLKLLISKKSKISLEDFDKGLAQIKNSPLLSDLLKKYQ